MLTKLNKLTQLGSSLMVLAALMFAFACSSDDEGTPTDPDPDPDPVVVVIPDNELATIIRETLGLGSNDDITEDDMEELTELNLTNSIVEKLDGLEKAINLEVFLARNTVFESMEPITGLSKLKRIDMRDATITDTDLAFLSDLNSLENIDFQNTAVDDIEVLSGKNTLTHINLRETEVSDIAPLTGMTQLLFLNLNRAGGGNGVTNPEVTIPMDKLYYLSLRNTVVGDEKFSQIFENKTRMVETNMRNTGISSVAPLIPLFEAGAFSVALSEEVGNKRSLDLQNQVIPDLCDLKPYADLFDENNELEWSVTGDNISSFDDCQD